MPSQVLHLLLDCTLVRSLRAGQIRMLVFTRGWSLKCPQLAGAVQQRCGQGYLKLLTAP